MYGIYKDFGTIIGFLIMTLIISAFGEKVERYFLLLTLLSMAILNSNKFNTMLQSTFKKEE